MKKTASSDLTFFAKSYLFAGFAIAIRTSEAFDQQQVGLSLQHHQTPLWWQQYGKAGSWQYQTVSPHSQICLASSPKIKHKLMFKCFLNTKLKYLKRSPKQIH
jgi:hypothetical protein